MRNGWRWCLAAASLLLVTACNQDEKAGLTPAAQGNPPRTDVRIEMRPVAEDGKPGVEVRFADGETVKLANPPVFTTGAIARVRQTVDAEGKATVYYAFTEAAAPRIHSATERLVGRTMVLTVDGEPISRATLSGPFGESMMTSGLEADEAAALVTRLTGRP
jgi:preprotein translocase subunit SecD